MAKKKEKITKRHTPIKISRWLFYTAVIILIIIIIVITTQRKNISLGSFFRKPTPTPSPTITRFGGSFLSEKEYTDKSIDELAKRLNIDREEIKILRVEKQEWANTSLGCPQKDTFYAEVITPGYEIELLVKGKKYIYHTGLNQVLFCSNG